MNNSIATTFGVFALFATGLFAAERVSAGYDAWPFDAAEAARRQTETSLATGQPIVLRTPLAGKDGPALVWRLIPAAKFMMGSPAAEPGHEGDERLHSETIAEPFYMMETQLTVEQYHALMQAEPSEGGNENDSKVPAGIPYRDTVDKAARIMRSPAAMARAWRTS